MCECMVFVHRVNLIHGKNTITTKLTEEKEKRKKKQQKAQTILSSNQAVSSESIWSFKSGKDKQMDISDRWIY